MDHVAQIAYNTPSPKDFLNFRAMIIRAIAKCWIDEAYKNKFISDPVAALEEFPHYHYPYTAKVTVDRDSAVYRPDLVNNWQCKIFSSITLKLPPAPKESERAQALAAYNAMYLMFLRTPEPDSCDMRK